MALGVQATRSAGLFLHECGLDQASTAVGAAIPWLRRIDYTIGTAWLIAILRRREALKTGWQRCSALAPGLVAVMGTLLPGSAAFIVYTSAFLTMIVRLALEVCRTHGVSAATLLRPTRGTGPSGRLEWAHWITDGLWLMGTAGLSIRLVNVLAARLDQVAPVLHTAQAEALGLSGSAALAVTNIVGSAVLEELIMVGVVCALGRAAAWPLWLIYTVSAALRILGHIYLGAPAVGVLVLGVGSVCLYLTRGRLTALLAGHVVFDLVQTFLVT